ncbi:MAG: peptide chain release factor N(5)-glutamine methyltransferase [Mycobacteriaceae bacterium]
MTLLREAILAATATLARAGIDSARTDAELLAAHLVGTDRGRLALLDAPGPEFFDRFDQAIATRAQRTPLQHITGTAPFGPVQLHVGPGVFTPRPETEAMLEWALAQPLPGDAVILDLCTGSGALAIALASQRPRARVIAVDDDATALGYARRNAAGTTVRLVHGDVTDAGLLAELIGSVDLVVANPPYIPIGTALEPEVARHDPAHALFAGADGMSVIEPLVGRAADWLKPGGLLAVEHDDTTSEATARIMIRAGVFGDITAHRDLTGRPRFVTARALQRGDR